MNIKVHRYLDEELEEDFVSITVDNDKTVVMLDEFEDSNGMYSHILGYALSKRSDKWSYDVKREELCDTDYDSIYTCRVYYDSELVIESSYNEYNGCGDGVGIVQTIDAFAEFDVDVEIEQDPCSGGWCYDEIN